MRPLRITKDEYSKCKGDQIRDWRCSGKAAIPVATSMNVVANLGGKDGLPCLAANHVQLDFGK